MKSLACLLLLLIPSTGGADWTAVHAFDLTETQFRVVVRDARASSAHVDIAVSSLLTDRKALRRDGYGGETAPQVVLESLTDRDKGDFMFDAGHWTPGSFSSPPRFIETYPCGFKYEVNAKGNALIVEIRPVFQLPSGSLVPWTAARGDKRMRRLRSSLAKCRNAQQAIPGLEQAANSARTAANSKQGHFTGAANAAVRAEQTLVQAKRMAAAIPGIERELAAADALANYSQKIAKHSRIHVAVKIGNESVLIGDTRNGDSTELRVWKALQGGHTFRARFAGLTADGNSVVLHGESRTVTVPLDKLSSDDNRYVAAYVENRQD